MQAAFTFEDDQLPDAGPTPPSGEIPPEFQMAPSITRKETDAGFSSTEAWGQSNMTYFGSHARQVLNLALRFNNAQVANPSFKTEAADLFPNWRGLWTDGRVVTPNPCGHTLQATSEHSAWHQFPLVGSWSTWGNTTQSTTKSAQQPPCAPDEPTAGGGGGPDFYVCYCLDYYNSATNQWEHGGIIYCVGM
jgi:hypothetical protein